jgi:hypothetical protein
VTQRQAVYKALKDKCNHYIHVESKEYESSGGHTKARKTDLLTVEIDLCTNRAIEACSGFTVYDSSSFKPLLELTPEKLR